MVDEASSQQGDASGYVLGAVKSYTLTFDCRRVGTAHPAFVNSQRFTRTCYQSMSLVSEENGTLPLGGCPAASRVPYFNRPLQWLWFAVPSSAVAGTERGSTSWR